jgi:hypothetical protein
VGSEFALSAWTHESGSTWRRLARIDTWASASFEERFLQAGVWSATLPFTPQTSPVGRKSILTCDFRAGRYTGIVDHAEVTRDGKNRPVLDLSGVNALGILGRSNCWPVPSVPAVAGDVTQTAAYYTDSGAVETVLRRLILANAINRDGQPFTVEPDQGRGGQLSPPLKVRNTNLLEVVTRECRTADLGVRVGLVADDPDSTTAELTCSFFMPRDRSKEFRISTDAGTLRQWSQSSDAPTGTRALVAGGGDGAARVLRLVIDTAAEAKYERQVEIFVDARDTSDPVELDKRGWQALADAAAQSSSTIEATDAVGMKYDGGDLIQVGDLLTESLLEGESAVERLEAVTFAQEVGSPLSVTLVPGNADGSNPMFKFASIVRQIHRDVSALQRET